MTGKEIEEALENLKLERVKSYRVSAEVISQWNLKTLYKGVEANLGNADAYIKTNRWDLFEDLTEEKEEALQSVESFLKEFFLRTIQKSLQKYSQ